MSLDSSTVTAPQHSSGPPVSQAVQIQLSGIRPELIDVEPGEVALIWYTAEEVNQGVDQAFLLRSAVQNEMLKIVFQQTGQQFRLRQAPPARRRKLNSTDMSKKFTHFAPGAKWVNLPRLYPAQSG